MGDYFKAGVWNVICDSCGFQRKSDEVRKRWDGFIVCADTCWEPRHPLDFMRGRKEIISVPFTRPEHTDTFVAGPTCTIEHRQAKAGSGTAGCAMAGLSSEL